MDTPNSDARIRHLGAAQGVSRRGFLRTAGAVGLAATAGTAALGALSARPALAANPRSFLGSYEGPPGNPSRQWFDQIRAVVPDLNGYRQYDPTTNYPVQNSDGSWQNKFATQWPDPPYVGYTGPSVFSIYVAPSTVSGSQAAQTRADIEKLMASAKNPRSYLSAWHEFGNISYNDFGSNHINYGLTADNVKAVHNFLCGIAAEYANVTYGPILFAPKVHDLASLQAAFQSCPKGMGFYGVDVYGNNGTAAGLAQLENFISLAKPLNASNYPLLLVAETNTPLPETFSFTATAMGAFFGAAGSILTNGQPVQLLGSPVPGGFVAGKMYYMLDASDDSFQLSDTPFGNALPIGSSCSGLLATMPAPRAGDPGTGWFESVCNRMHIYGTNSIGVLTFWNVNGQLSGGWDPTDTATISSLNYCADHIF